MRNRSRYKRKLLLEPLVSADHLGQGLRGLSFVGDQRIFIHCLHGLGITRKNFEDGWPMSWLPAASSHTPSMVSAAPGGVLGACCPLLEVGGPGVDSRHRSAR